MYPFVRLFIQEESQIRFQEGRNEDILKLVQTSITNIDPA